MGGVARVIEAVATGGWSEVSRKSGGPTVTGEVTKAVDEVSGAKEMREQAAAEQARLQQEEQNRQAEEARLKDEEAKRQNEERERARMAGPGSRASTLLTGGQGTEEEDLNVARRTLLGS